MDESVGPIRMPPPGTTNMVKETRAATAWEASGKTTCTYLKVIQEEVQYNEIHCVMTCSNKLVVEIRENVF